MKVIVFKVSSTPITLIFVEIVASELLIIEAEKSDLFNAYKKLFYSFNVIYYFNTGETELGIKLFPRVV